MPLALDSLIKSISALERSLNAANAKISRLDVDIQEAVRAGVIQNFEVAYEQCWKFIRRWIRENRSPDDADNIRTRKELFKMAAASGLISDPEPWFAFGDARNLSSHTYDSAQAFLIYETAERFLPYALELFKHLKEDND